MRPSPFYEIQETLLGDIILERKSPTPATTQLAHVYDRITATPEHDLEEFDVSG